MPYLWDLVQLTLQPSGEVWQAELLQVSMCRKTAAPDTLKQRVTLANLNIEVRVEAIFLIGRESGLVGHRRRDPSRTVSNIWLQVVKLY